MNRLHAIFNRESKQYFTGWDTNNIPVWADEANLAYVYTSTTEADEQFEILRQLGYDVEVS